MYRPLMLAMLTACTPAPVETPFEGPLGVTTLETSQTEVLVAMTHLRVRNAPGPGKRLPAKYVNIAANSGEWRTKLVWGVSGEALLRAE